MLNKFGKTEAEGGGTRALIAAAVARGVPVLIAVPDRNLESWRAFAGELAVELRLEDLTGAADLLAALGSPGDVRRSPGVLRAPSAAAE